VDGHSTDDTVAVAQAILPNVRIVLQAGHGKGNALACGFAAARGDIIVMLDADGSTDPAEIPAYVEPLLSGADFAKGSRYADGGRSVDITPLRALGNRFLNGMVNLLFGTSYTDLCYGYNAFWRDILPTIDITCDGFEVETLITARVAKAGLSVAEVPSVEHERIHGVSKLHPMRDGLRILRMILRERPPRNSKQDKLFFTFVHEFVPVNAADARRSVAAGRRMPGTQVAGRETDHVDEPQGEGSTDALQVRALELPMSRVGERDGLRLTCPLQANAQLL
jgi:glycosyltransferase involved in cell wall biosynthesis